MFERLLWLVPNINSSQKALINSEIITNILYHHNRPFAPHIVIATININKTITSSAPSRDSLDFQSEYYITMSKPIQTFSNTTNNSNQVFYPAVSKYQIMVNHASIFPFLYDSSKCRSKLVSHILNSSVIQIENVHY
jgi:hypothetical protein